MFKELILVVSVDVSQYKFIILWNIAVAPFAGAWIEIASVNPYPTAPEVAPFAGARIEIWLEWKHRKLLMTLLLQKCMIEMQHQKNNR